MTNVFLGRSIESELELTAWDPPREFRYTARQPGRPELDNRRVFEQVPGGTQMSGTTELAVRPGLTGLIDQVQVRALRGVREGDAAIARGRARDPGRDRRLSRLTASPRGVHPASRAGGRGAPNDNNQFPT